MCFHGLDLLYVSAYLPRWLTLTGTVMVESGQLVAHSLPVHLATDGVDARGAEHLQQELCSATTPSSSLWTLTRAARIIVRDHNLAAEGLLDNDTMHAPAPSWVASR
jgi:hypothetical protein